MKQKPEWVDWVEAKILQKTVIIDEAGHYLLLTRAINDHSARIGKNDLSGGSLSKQDFEGAKKNSHIESIRREVLEETGLNVNNFEIVYVVSGTETTQSVGEIIVLSFGYKCKVIGVKPELKLSDEHTSYSWVSKEEALNADYGEDGGLHKAIVENS